MSDAGRLRAAAESLDQLREQIISAMRAILTIEDELWRLAKETEQKDCETMLTTKGSDDGKHED